jgi:hypothetical protein
MSAEGQKGNAAKTGMGWIVVLVWVVRKRHTGSWKRVQLGSGS